MTFLLKTSLLVSLSLDMNRLQIHLPFIIHTDTTVQVQVTKKCYLSAKSRFLNEVSGEK